MLLDKVWEVEKNPIVSLLFRIRKIQFSIFVIENVGKKLISFNKYMNSKTTT